MSREPTSGTGWEATRGQDLFRSGSHREGEVFIQKPALTSVQGDRHHLSKFLYVPPSIPSVRDTHQSGIHGPSVTPPSSNHHEARRIRSVLPSSPSPTRLGGLPVDSSPGLPEFSEALRPGVSRSTSPPRQTGASARHHRSGGLGQSRPPTGTDQSGCPTGGPRNGLREINTGSGARGSGGTPGTVGRPSSLVLVPGLPDLVPGRGLEVARAAPKVVLPLGTELASCRVQYV